MIEDHLYSTDEMLADDVIGAFEPASLYLFQSSSSSIEFFIIQTEMAQLNDLCVMLCTQVERKIEDIRRYKSKLESGEERAIVTIPGVGQVADYYHMLGKVIKGIEDPTNLPGESDDLTYEGILFADESLLWWEDMRSALVPSICVLLLASFEERSLKALSLALGPEGSNHKIGNGGRSKRKVDRFLDYLHDECSLEFTKPPEAIEVQDQIHDIRNTFAHGDWDELGAKTSDLSLPDLFYGVSKLLESLEVAKYGAPSWANKDSR
jgi:hypothetical protein